ncbi:MAG: PD40 domain-containing protein [Ignavibacteria bacterium]|nr:PD40 domain-containing protein [Ignavibacteria bacterium]
MKRNLKAPFNVDTIAISELSLRIILYVLLIFCASIASAQFNGQLPFGKNKVQYQKFEWKYIQSDNFDVYFHQGGNYIAKFTAMKAEKALQEIQATLSFEITKRIVIIVYNSHNQFQQTNVIDEYMSEGIGGVTELFKNRVVIPFEGDYQKFAHVIHHELVHAVINDMFYGGSIQSLISNSAGAMLPLWMNEGFAEYSSTGGLDVKTDMFMRDVAVSEYLRGLNQLNGYFAYRGGQAFWSYVAEKYGKEKVGEVLNRFKSTGNVNATFKSSFGMTYEEMSDQWAKDTKKFYFPDVDRYEYVEDYSNRLTNHQKENYFYNTSPAISPDGEKVAFISDRGEGSFGLYVMDLATKKVDKLASSARSTDFEELNFLTPGISWDPTGKKLAVGAKAGGQDGVYVIDVATGKFNVLTFDIQTVGGVAWSPDGKSIAFDAAPNGDQSDIYVYEIATKKLRAVTNDIFSDLEPVWSPDSKYLYFISDRSNHLDGSQNSSNFEMWNYDVSQRDIYRIDVDNPVIERITTDPSIGKYTIAVVPDHKSILFVADYNGISNLWELDLATGAKRARTNSLQEVSQISLSVDGTKLLFSSQNRVGYDLFLIKYPLEVKTKDSLPMTRFRQRVIDENNSLAGIMDKLSAPADTVSMSYGSFDLSPSTENSVSKNDEAINGVSTVSAASAQPKMDTTARDYKIAFTPDIITGQAGYSNWFGAQGTIQMLFSDMLGDHEIYFQTNLYLDIVNSNFYLSYGYLRDVVDYHFAGFHNAGYTYITVGNQSTLNRLRNYGATGWLTVPFSRYDRIDIGLTAQAMARENIDIPTMPSVDRFVTVPSISYVHDDAVMGMWAPVNGNRLNLTLEGSPKVVTNGLSFATFRTDARKYIGFGGAYTLALRGSGGISMGANPQKFFIGGVDNWLNRSFSAAGWPFVEPEDFAFTRPGWPLRGFSLNERNGSRYFVANAELRFPLLFAFQAGPLPSLFQGLQGQFFLDAGGAFDINGDAWSDYSRRIAAPNPVIYSLGFGIRSIALGMPLRFDVAWRKEPGPGFSSPVYLFSLGGDF